MVKANRVDALILDTAQRYAELGAIHLGVPYLHASVALHLDYSGYTPPFYRSWPHETTPQALARNREAIAQIAEMLGRANDQGRQPVPSPRLTLRREQVAKVGLAPFTIHSWRVA